MKRAGKWKSGVEVGVGVVMVMGVEWVKWKVESKKVGSGSVKVKVK